MKEWERLKKEHYMEDLVIQHNEGFINFSPKSMQDFTNEDIKSYDEYLDIQLRSAESSRTYFGFCYYGDYFSYFNGQVERITSTNILFTQIRVEGMYHDGLGFKGAEDHVWIDIKGFEDCKVGDCLSFSAEVYRYIKKGNGKLIDYGLKNPNDIKITEPYEVPTNEDLINQQIEQLICETCLFYDHCYLGPCIANKKEKEKTFKFLKQLEPGKFTTRTVLAAYEIAGQVFTQITGGHIDKKSPHYKISKKILKEAKKLNAGQVWPLEKALPNLLQPDKPRIYIGEEE